MDSIEKELQNNIRMAEQGRKIWLNLNEKYKFSRNDYVVLIPSLDEICNYYAIYYLDEFSKLRKAERIFILTYDENVIKEIETKMKSKNKDGIKDEDECEREVIYKVVDFSRESAVCLMKL
ncbi:MAG: hypothetical protein PUE01_11745, partial [Clostridiaceae bacterium]|nr:hypothetical protein [Clostridiaceae bacterium]